MPGDINKVAVDVNALAKQTNSISNNLIIKYSYAGTNYQLTVHVNYKYGFGITTINKNYNQKDFEHGSIKINLKTKWQNLKEMLVLLELLSNQSIQVMAFWLAKRY